MNSKRIPLILIALAFFMAVLCSCYFLFTIAKVDTTYAVSESIDTTKMQEKLDKLKGRSIFLFNETDVIEIMEEYPTCKITKIEKKLPNHILLKIEERLPVYKTEIQGTTYLLDYEGGGVKEGQGDIADRELIELKLDGINCFSNVKIGDKLNTDRDEILSNSFLMAKEIELTDLVKTMKVNYLDAGENRDVIFYTYTGVEIIITKSNESGIEKAKKAIESYDSCQIDAIKSYNQILVVMQDDGKITVTWTKNWWSG